MTARNSLTHTDYICEQQQFSKHMYNCALQLLDRASDQHRVGGSFAGGDASPLAAHRLQDAVRPLADRQQYRSRSRAPPPSATELRCSSPDNCWLADAWPQFRTTISQLQTVLFIVRAFNNICLPLQSYQSSDFENSYFLESVFLLLKL